MASGGKQVLEKCFVCDEIIKESDGEDKGQPALYCEGLHKGWAHATCVGISDEAYQLLDECDSPWICPECVKFSIRAINDLVNLKAEVSRLSTENKTLHQEIKSLQSAVTSHESRINVLSASVDQSHNLTSPKVNDCPNHIRNNESSPPVSKVPVPQEDPHKSLVSPKERGNST